MTEALREFIDEIEAERERKWWTATQLCKEAGIGKYYWLEIRSGRKAPSIKTLDKVCKALKLKLIICTVENDDAL